MSVIELLMPKLNDKMEEGTVVSLEIEAGQHFQAGESLFAVETNKVVSHVEADRAGKLVSWLIEEGDNVAVDAPIAKIEIA